MKKTLEWLGLGLLGGLLLVGVEVLALALRAGRVLSGGWELSAGFSALGPAWILLGLPLAGLGGALAAPHRRAFVVRAVALGLLAALVGYFIGGGRHLSAPLLRFGFALAVGVGGGGLGALVLGLAPRLLAGGDARARPAVLGLVAAAGACGLGALEVVNQLVLPRLYAAFHAGLSGSVFVFGGALLAALGMQVIPERARRALGVVGALGLLASGALLVPQSQKAARLDNFRWLAAEHSATLGLGVQLAAKVAPPPPADPSVLSAPLGAPRSRGGLSFGGRSILVVTVDALRADHVGAYGYQRKTTPHLDVLSSHGVTFDAAYAATPHTSYSLTSLMTGKYMKPLLAQGVGGDSETLAMLLRRYGYRTAAFYPPAVFFIDADRFGPFEKQHLGFEYAKVEFAEGKKRTEQVKGYLEGLPEGMPALVWVHLFGPHEPYEAHPEHDFGTRDVDRYDSEIRAADETIGTLAALMRARDPSSVVLVSADHGEEFGEHGGRYHGTTVYEEQVRVPLVVSGPGLSAGRRVPFPVQTIDVLPTLLGGLGIPVPPRVRGRDLSGFLAGGELPDDPGQAFAESDGYTLFAERRHRLICERRSEACRLFDLELDPTETSDVSQQQPDALLRLTERVRALSASHGHYELAHGGRAWPAPIVRGLSGDASAAPELALLLDDADRTMREKAAELLFSLATEREAAALRLALGREESPSAQNWLALTLTRLGQGAPRVRELLAGSDVRMRRLAALALASAGDRSGEEELVGWWSASEARTYEEELALLDTFAKLRTKDAVGPLARRLGDVRLRPHLAKALGQIGDDDAVGPLTAVLRKERYQTARVALLDALRELGAKTELAGPVTLFLGVPDPTTSGLRIAEEVGILDDVGGPGERDLARLRQLSDSGVDVSVNVPPLGKAARGEAVQAGSEGGRVRLLVLARRVGQGSRVSVSPARPRIHTKDEDSTFRNLPQIDAANRLELNLSPGAEWQVAYATLPAGFGAAPGRRVGLTVFAEGGVEVRSLALVPLRDELPPPPPEKWTPGQDVLAPSAEPGDAVPVD